MRRVIAFTWSLARRAASSVLPGDRSQSPQSSFGPYRVLFVSHSAGLAGAERCLLDLLRHIDRLRITPFVLLPERGPIEQELQQIGVSYRVVRYEWWLAQRNWLPIFGWRVLRSLVSFPRLLLIARRVSPDLVYTNSLVVPEGAILAALLRRKHIWHVREIVAGNETLSGPLPLEFILRATLRLSSRVIAISESVRSQYPADIRDRVLTIYDGVDLPAGCSAARRHDCPPAGAIELAVIGTLSEAKGQLVAVETVRQLLETIPAISLAIIGAGKPAFQRRLSSYVEEHGLTAQVRLTGPIQDVTSVLDTTDILLMPSRAEAFGRVTVEALGAGVPVVGTNTGGTAEILSHGGGVLVPPGRPDLMAAAVRDLLNSPDRLTDFRRQARRTAERFTAARNAELVQREVLAVIAGTR